MTSQLGEALQCVLAGQDLTPDQMCNAIGAVMDGQADDVQFAALLTALRIKGESTGELVGAARAMRERSTRIHTQRSGLLDTCGTGGDRLHSFNISTATALVAAASGVPVAKHGNRSVSSSSGSADVLEALGVNIALAPERVGSCLDDLGIAFCFAPLIHGAMKHAAPVRKRLGFRTIFNLLGPLTNPAGADFQLLGVNEAQTAVKVAGALAELGVRSGTVVCGAGELDEVSLWGTTTVFRVTGGQVLHDEWTASSFGLDECRVEELRVESADESASVIRGIVNGTAGPARRIVIANAAAALMTAERADSLDQAARTASGAIDSGAARQLLERLVEYTNA